MLTHGIPKMSKFGEDPIQFADPLGFGVFLSLVLAVFAEVICAAAVAVGAATRAACVPLIITMLVAAFIVHGEDPWARKEFAIVYALPFTALLLTGPGAFSVDRKLFRRRG
jgi:putative oxidoreductase